MKKFLFVAILIFCGGPAVQALERENWHSVSMEATAIMGELKYQRGDLDEAQGTFRDSLESSTKLLAPRSQVMGLDLYRSAEIALRKGDLFKARENLEILLSRYSDSSFAPRARALLATLPKHALPERDEDPATTPTMSTRCRRRLLAISHPYGTIELRKSLTPRRLPQP